MSVHRRGLRGAWDEWLAMLSHWLLHMALRVLPKSHPEALPLATALLAYFKGATDRIIARTPTHRLRRLAEIAPSASREIFAELQRRGAA